MLLRFTLLLVLFGAIHPPPLAADSILDELTLIDPGGDRTTLALTMDAAGDSVYTFVSPSFNPQTSTPPVVNLTDGLLDLILSLDGSGANLAPLFAPGAVFAQLTPEFMPVVTGASWSTSSASDSPSSSTTVSSLSMPAFTSATEASNTPEPGTLSLAIGLVLVLTAGAFAKVRRLRKAPCVTRGKPPKNEPL